jgi:hypothetical protein
MIELQKVLIYLLKGVVYQEQNLEIWNHLIANRIAVIDYFKMINLELLVDEVEGYAFLRQYDSASNIDEENDLPQLIVRRQLNYGVSLLCVLLRKKMLEHDTSSGEVRVIITKEQIIAMMMLYLPNRSNEAKTTEQIETCINKLIELGFLRKLKSEGNSFEVKRIIKAFIDATWLSNLDKKLEEYGRYVSDAE